MSLLFRDTAARQHARVLQRSAALIASDIDQLQATVARLTAWLGSLGSERRDRVVYYVAVVTCAFIPPQVAGSYFGMNFPDMIAGSATQYGVALFYYVTLVLFAALLAAILLIRFCTARSQ